MPTNSKRHILRFDGSGLTFCGWRLDNPTPDADECQQCERALEAWRKFHYDGRIKLFRFRPTDGCLVTAPTIDGLRSAAPAKYHATLETYISRWRSRKNNGGNT